nr:transcriptional regulator TetR family [Glycomyces sp. NRRL B-16210]
MKGRATRERIIEAASRRLRSEEPGEMRLDDLLADTGTSKGQLFHYFPGGKEELLLVVAGREADRVLAEQEPYLSELGSPESWRAWRDALVARYGAQGENCPLGSLMGQVRSTAGVAAVVSAMLRQWQDHLRDGVRAAQAAGTADPGVDAERAAAALIAGVQGGVHVLRSTGDSGHLEAALDEFLDRLGRT